MDLVIILDSPVHPVNNKISITLQTSGIVCLNLIDSTCIMGSVSSEDIACEIDPFEVKNTDVPFSLNMDKLTRHRAH